jgi:hypothetical protein
MLQRLRIGFPVLSIKRFNGDLLGEASPEVQAPAVDVIAIWVGSWDIKGGNPTASAEVVLGGVGAESVGGHGFGTR